MRPSRRPRILAASGLAAALLGTLLATGAEAVPVAGSEAGAVGTTIGAPDVVVASRRPAARPPRADVRPRDLVVTELFVTTDVDTDRDGVPDRVRVLLTRPRAAAVDGRRLAVVGHASPYFSCCRTVRNHDVDVPLGQAGPRDTAADVPDSMRDGLREEGAQWARRGYAYVRIASLGSNGSTGCPTIGDRDEADGVTSVVDWLNGRAEGRTPGGRSVGTGWTTGDVGLVGVSYDGTLPTMAAATGVEGLKAIVPISAISSWYGYYRQDGLVVAPGGYQGEDTDVLARFNYTRADREICKPVIAGLERRQDRRTGDFSPFWAARHDLDDAGRVRAATLIAHGFGDTNVKPDQAARWYAALRRAGVPTKLWWDQGGHGTPIPDRLVTRWFDRFLYGVRNGVEAGPDAAVTTPTDRGSRTRWYATWPRPGSSAVTMRPTVDGLRTGAAGRGRVRFTDDPSRNASEACRTPGSEHAATFRTRPDRTGLDLSGTPRARVRVAFGTTAANLTVALCEVTTDGASVLLTQGWADPQNTRSLTSSRPLTRGRFYDVDVRLQPLDRRLAPRSRLALVVMASDHDFTIRPPAGTRVTLDLARSRVEVPVVG